MPDATTTTIAPTHRVELNASTNDVCAACTIARPARRRSPRPDCNASASECVAFAGRPRDRAVHRAAELRRHQAAHHRDAERAAELAGGVVHRRADARLVQRQRPHDRPRRRCGGDAHAQRLHHDSEREPPVARVTLLVSASSAMPSPAMVRPDATTSRWPKRSTSLADCVADTRYASAHGRMRTPGRQRRVAVHELQVLGEEEVRAEHGEEHERDRRGRRGEAGVAEVAEVEHRLLRPQLPRHERTRGPRPRRRTSPASASNIHPWSGASMIP